ncbi:MAG TPA: biotin--[acetyl-CoA-carboxylase] ligase [Firmicutes bacterium]|nr:biotin--[acetyl-CoA-carboxylase] ligase [Bacillota bacterium]
MNSHVKSIQWGKGIVKTIQVYSIVGSTNQFARSFIKSGGASGTVLWALKQTAGRGRLGRTWDADESSLTFSVVYQCPKNVLLDNLTLAVGLGLAQSLEVYFPQIKVKWPNDLWIAGKKLGGILGETVHHQGSLWVVLGVGLNVNNSPGKEGGGRISLREATGSLWPRLGILDLALLGVERGFALAYSKQDLSGLFRKHGNFIDRPIEVYQGGAVFRAIAREVLPDGRLLIEDARGHRALLPEEISVRF